MNLLLDLLTISEDLRANVHVNPNGELKVILDLLKKEFNLYSDSLSQTCLWAQSAYAIALKLNVNPQIIGDELDNSLRKAPSIFDDFENEKGITPQQVVDGLNGRVVKLKRGSFKLKVGFISYHSFQEVLKAIDEGHPVIVPLNDRSPMHRHIQGFASQTRGVIPKFSANQEQVTNHMSDSYHAYLAIGYDKGDKTLVLRDSRSSYSYKGYSKVPFAVAKQHVSIAFTYTVDVEKVA